MDSTSTIGNPAYQELGIEMNTRPIYPTAPTTAATESPSPMGSPEKVDLDVLDLEVLTNYTSFIHLTKAFWPFLQKPAPKKTAMIYTTSGLALVPIGYCPNSCSTKAAIHHMCLAMREQLRDANSNVKVVELLPPAVQTELHDFEFGDKRKDIGMPLKDFTKEAFEGLFKEGKEGEQVPVQMVKRNFDTWEQERQKNMLQMMEMIKSSRIVVSVRLELRIFMKSHLSQPIEGRRQKSQLGGGAYRSCFMQKEYLLLTG